MLLNTKQVRVLGKAFCGKAAGWTDKTLKKDKANKRRSVVWQLWTTQEADALVAHFKKMGVTNKITRTSVAVNMFTHNAGGEYVRVIANKE